MPATPPFSFLSPQPLADDTFISDIISSHITTLLAIDAITTLY
jgi:hypothetical protein